MQIPRGQVRSLYFCVLLLLFNSLSDHIGYYYRRYLKDCLSISNDEDVMRVSAAALVLLGHIFLRYQNVQECSNMLKPALELAGNIKDVPLQLWACSLLKGLLLLRGGTPIGMLCCLEMGTIVYLEVYRLCSDTENESETIRIVDNYFNRLESDREKARAMDEHQVLINWTDGFLPAFCAFSN